MDEPVISKNTEDAPPRERTHPLMQRFKFGGRLAHTLLTLVVASILVGAFFHFIGVSPREFWSGVFNFARGAVAMLGDSLGEIIGTLLTYLLIGAAIVLPIWLVSRFFSGGRK